MQAKNSDTPNLKSRAKFLPPSIITLSRSESQIKDEVSASIYYHTKPLRQPLDHQGSFLRCCLRIKLMFIQGSSTGRRLQERKFQCSFSARKFHYAATFVWVSMPSPSCYSSVLQSAEDSSDGGESGSL